MIRDYLSYDPETGVLTWKESPGYRVAKGDVAGHFCSHHKYHSVQIGGRGFKGHRVAWFLYYGEWPKGQIDHINGDRGDNRIANLREATHLQNMWNKPSYKNRTSKFKGVSYRKDLGKWRAVIQKDGKSLSIGHFESELEAALAYNYKAEELFGSYARFNKVF